jgi:2,4-dienoyl-CoA reductase-like NADH-dependent reductase (Old Yellow Enzyme family)
MTNLFTPLKIKDITLKNRLTISPMCQYSSVDGFANNWHLVHYGSRAVGGAGLIIQEATAVTPEGRITPGDLGIYSDEHIEKLRQITRFIEAHGAIPGIQIAHAGRKGSCSRPWEGGTQLGLNEGGWDTIAPSALTFNTEDRVPQVLDKKGIVDIMDCFAKAAHRAIEAGYKVLEIHSAHGYLIHEFLSPLSNHRKDEYGGSFENRIRLLLGVVKSVQSVWPDKLPLFVRISATDWADGGWDVNEAVKLAPILKNEGVDLIDCSSGGMVPWAKIPFGPGYQVPFSDRIKNETGILTGAVGMITEARQAEEILAKNQADLILIGRESLRNPYFPLYAAMELDEGTEWPLPYLRSKV